MKDAARFARRATVVEPFLVMEVLERAQELERAGKSIIHLEVGEPDFDTPPVILQAGRSAIDRGETHYTHSLGLAELREAIARRYLERYGGKVSPDQVLVTMGSSPAFLYLFAALVEHGDEVIVGTPHYSCYPNFIRFFGGRMVEVPTDSRGRLPAGPDSRPEGDDGKDESDAHQLALQSDGRRARRGAPARDRGARRADHPRRDLPRPRVRGARALDPRVHRPGLRARRLLEALRDDGMAARLPDLPRGGPAGLPEDAAELREVAGIRPPSG